MSERQTIDDMVGPQLPVLRIIEKGMGTSPDTTPCPRIAARHSRGEEKTRKTIYHWEGFWKVIH